MNSRIFRSVFFMTILMLVMGLGMSLVISYYLSIKNDSAILKNFTDNLSTYLNENADADLNLLKIGPYRVNLIHPTGQVFFDSVIKDDHLANHADREEFIQALKKGQSRVFRYSETLGKRTVYIAKRLKSGDVLRCAYTVDNTFAETKSLGLHILMILALAVVVSLFLAHRISESIVNPINNIDLKAPEEGEIYEELRPLVDRLISHRRRIKKLLRKVTAANSQISVMTSRLSEAIILLNKKWEVITLNESARKIFDIRQDCEGVSLLAVDNNPLFCRLYEERESIESFKKDVEISGRFYNLIFNKIESDGRLIGFVMLFVDVTKARALQKQRQEFAANVSHELKTPLQSIIGRAELIENGIVKKDDLAKFGTRIREEGQSLLNMINDIMFLSRIESGVKNTKESVNLKNLAMGIVDNLKDKALRCDVTLALDCPDNLEVYFVRRYMSEILNNLIDNAIKYNREHGKVYILIKKDSKNIEIRVSDTGIGIPDDDIERIFERFFCVDRSHSSRDSTGLGLTIVKHIVEECSGTIEVKSKLGEGTTFCISIPDDSSAPAQLPPK